MIALIVIASVMVVAGVAFYVWQRSVARDVDFADLEKNSTQTDEERRAKQFGISMTSTNNFGGY